MYGLVCPNHCKCMTHPHLLVWATSEQRIPTSVTSSGFHWPNQLSKWFLLVGIVQWWPTPVSVGGLVELRTWAPVFPTSHVAEVYVVPRGWSTAGAAASSHSHANGERLFVPTFAYVHILHSSFRPFCISTCVYACERKENGSLRLICNKKKNSQTDFRGGQSASPPSPADLDEIHRLSTRSHGWLLMCATPIAHINLRLI